jgi:DNA-binding TFAR19-related protein (PDSD5 family)
MDEKLERIKKRRMLELQRQLLLKQSEEEQKQVKEGKEEKEPTKIEILNSVFIDRAWEVYRTAWSQYPRIMPEIETLLVEAIKNGKIKQKITGAELFQFFKQIGSPVRLETKIRYSEKGELRTLQDKIRNDLR